jgi:hypothetical protein
MAIQTGEALRDYGELGNDAVGAETLFFKSIIHQPKYGINSRTK